MIRNIEAVFDGNVLHPTEPLELEPDTRVRITVEESDVAFETKDSFLDTARSLKLDGPVDWSENIDAYLYGGRLNSDE